MYIMPPSEGGIFLPFKGGKKHIKRNILWYELFDLHRFRGYPALQVLILFLPESTEGVAVGPRHETRALTFACIWSNLIRGPALSRTPAAPPESSHFDFLFIDFYSHFRPAGHLLSSNAQIGLNPVQLELKGGSAAPNALVRMR